MSPGSFFQNTTSAKIPADAKIPACLIPPPNDLRIRCALEKNVHGTKAVKLNI